MKTSRTEWTEGASVLLTRGRTWLKALLVQPSRARAAKLVQCRERSRLEEFQELAQGAQSVVSILQAPGSQSMKASSSKTTSADGVAR